MKLLTTSQTAFVVSLTMFSIIASPTAYALNEQSLVQEQKPELIEAIVNAVPKKRVSPKYPTRVAKMGGEGWVQISYVISEEGKVLEPRIIDSAGHNDLERAALRAIKKWTFEPAMENGEPIQQCDTKVQMDFSISNGGVTKKFSQFYRQAMMHLEKKNIDELTNMIKESDWDTGSNLYELTWYHYLKAEYFALIGDQENELTNLYKSTTKPKNESFRSHLANDIVARNLHKIFILEVNKNKLAQALKTYNSLKYVKGDLSLNSQKTLAPYVAKIEALISSDQPIFVSAQVPENRDWSHYLSRNSFAIDSIEGELDKLDIRCDNKRFTYTVVSNNQWTIPKKWGKCQVLVEGKDASRFQLIELNS